jgi:cyclohexa-1,5-dienecarbonyl-CoA hydratase
MPPDSVQTVERSGAFWVTLNRPPVNVLDISTIRALGRALDPLPGRRDLKAVVFRSGILGTFSAGVAIQDHARERASEMLEAFHAVFRAIDRLPQATVAAVDGRCLGGGCELAAFCDFVLATPRSVFGQPEIDVGCFPPVAAALLPRIIGRAAFDLILTGRPLSAEEAARVGLISRVVADLEPEVEDLVANLSGKSAAVLALARRALREGGHGSFADALSRTETLYRDELLPTEDIEEGVRAFLEKRKPRWSDR